MKRYLFLLAAVAGCSPGPSIAQADDLAYCTKLYDLAVKFRGRPINGDPKPDPVMIVAQEKCKHGDTAGGIAILEQRLRSADITPPPR